MPQIRRRIVSNQTRLGTALRKGTSDTDILFHRIAKNAGSYRQTEKLKATSLRAAKREAVCGRHFTALSLKSVARLNEDGFILNPVARKEVGKHWEDIEVK